MQGKRIVSLGPEPAASAGGTVARHGRGLTARCAQASARRSRRRRRPPRLGALRRWRVRHRRDGAARHGRRRRRGGSRPRLGRAGGRAPASRPRRPRRGRGRGRSRRLGGPHDLVVDRRRPLLGRAREGLVLLAFGVVGLAAGRRPGPPAARARTSPRRAARRGLRLGLAREGGSGARPRRRGPGRPPERLDRLLERARPACGRRARPRPLARSSRSATASAGRPARCSSSRRRS